MCIRFVSVFCVCVWFFYKNGGFIDKYIYFRQHALPLHFIRGVTTDPLASCALANGAFPWRTECHNPPLFFYIYSTALGYKMLSFSQHIVLSSSIKQHGNPVDKMHERAVCVL